MIATFLSLFLGDCAYAAEPRPNVLVLTVDAWRPDRMALYGYDRDTTPYLDRFANEAVVFENNYATGAWTSPGIASLFTGLYPPSHGQGSQQDVVDATLVTPLDVLAGAGYRTIGRDNSGPTIEGLGFRVAYGEAISDYKQAMAWLTTQRAPWVAWVHVKPTHLPYHPSPYALKRYGGDALDTPAIRAVRTSGTVFPKDYGLSWRPPVIPSFTAEEQRVVSDLYDGAMRDSDNLVGEIIEDLRSKGILDKTILVLTADHGEELFDHGWVGHASTGYEGKVYEELIRIPMLIRVPGQPGGRRVAAFTQQHDVMPTVFELLGLDPAQVDGGMQGRSLVGLMRGEGEGHPHVFARTTFKGWTCPAAETADGATAIRGGDLKLIRLRRGGVVTHEGYDLRADPDERTNLLPAQATRFDPLMRELDAWDKANQAHGANLMSIAAGRHLELLRIAAEKRDAVKAAESWRGIMALKQTYANEWLPPTADPAFRAKWGRWEQEARSYLDRASR